MTTVEPAWHKSSHSAQNTQCVEAAVTPTEQTFIRDSKVPARPWLTVSTGAWQEFVQTLSG